MAVFSRAFGRIHSRASLASARLCEPQAILFLKFCTCQGRYTAPLCLKATQIRTSPDLPENPTARFSAGQFISQLFLPGNQLFMFGHKIPKNSQKSQPRARTSSSQVPPLRPILPLRAAKRSEKTNRRSPGASGASSIVTVYVSTIRQGNSGLC